MTASGERPPATPARCVAESALVLAGALAYLWLFRTYGFDVVDEGTQLAQIDLVARGARPYLDFETGYTPLYFLLHATLWSIAPGAELLATRTFGVLLHAATIAVVYGCARRWFGARIALGLAAFDLAFLLPVSPRDGAPFNIPYPGWIAALLALLAQIAVVTVVVRRLGASVASRATRGWEALAVLGAGLASGLAFSVKPNAGVLALGGALLALLASWPATERGAVALAALVRAAAVAGAVVLLGPAATDPAYLLALALPVALAALRATPAGASGVARPLADATLLALGFVAPVAVWVTPLLRELGAARFAREVLLLDGGGVVAAYLLSFEPPGLAASAICLLLVALAVGASAARDRLHTLDVTPVARRLGPAVGVAVCVFAAAGLAGVVTSGTPVRLIAEQVCLWLGPLVLVVGIVLVPRGPATARTHALLAFAAVYSLQLFPRPDLIHVAMGAPPLLLALGATWSVLAAPLATSGRSRPLLAREVTAALLFLCLLRAEPALQVRFRAPLAPLFLGLAPRAPLMIALPYFAHYAWLREAVWAIEKRTAAGERVFYFPDLSGLGFLSGRPAATFYLYFVPGRPDAKGEQRTIDELERLAPRLAVTGTPRVPAFAGAEAYFARLLAELDRRYPREQVLKGVTLREK